MLLIGMIWHCIFSQKTQNMVWLENSYWGDFFFAHLRHLDVLKCCWMSKISLMSVGSHRRKIWFCYLLYSTQMSPIHLPPFANFLASLLKALHHHPINPTKAALFGQNVRHQMGTTSLKRKFVETYTVVWYQVSRFYIPPNWSKQQGHCGFIFQNWRSLFFLLCVVYK